METDRFASRLRLATPLRPFAAFALAASLFTFGPAAHAAAYAPATEAAPAAHAAEAGDLGARLEAAVTTREADPSAAHWRAEAEAHEALGNYAAAADAYRGELAALPEDAIDARRSSEADWARVRELSRGKVQDEPESTHRGELDAAWVPPAPPEQLRPVPRPKADPTLDDGGDDRIVTKWYFWVTVAAIAASAGAVAGIAIKAARDERGDALDASALTPAGGFGAGGPAVIRF